MLKIYFDGGCWPKNPGGFARAGYVIELDGQMIKKYHCTMAETETSNNVAEYGALILALEWLIDSGYKDHEIKVIGDSKLVISQMFRDWSIRGGLYAKYAEYCRLLVASFPKISGKLIPRELNNQADALTRIHSTDQVAVNHAESVW